MKQNLSLLIVMALALFACNKKEAASQPQEPPVIKVNTTPEPFGVNLAGAEFGRIPGVLNTHYGYPTAADLDYFKSKGLMLIRFPFRWERVQKTLNGALDAAEIGRMKTFIEAARARNMYILLDMHNYCRRNLTLEDVFYEIGSTEVPLATVGDVWKKLATEFKSYNNIWGYGIMNEPYGLTKTTWFNIAQSIITEIRKVDTETTIVVAGDAFSSASRWKEVSDNLKNLVDPSEDLIFEAHTYWDKSSSGSYQGTYDQEGATPNTGVARVTPFVEWLKANKRRGFVGEYGVPRDDPRWLVVLDNTLKYLKDNCVNGCYWAAGPRWPQDEHLSIQPWNGDLPQTAILQKYLQTNPENCK